MRLIPINDLLSNHTIIMDKWADTMEKLVTIRNLGREQAMLAFPLVREAASNVTPDGWCETVFKLTGDDADQEFPGGIVVAERNGLPRGLFTYQVTSFLAPDRRLLVRNLVVMEIICRMDATRALFDHMGELAVALDCRGVHVDLPPVSNWIQNQWHELAQPGLGVPFFCGD